MKETHVELLEAQLAIGKAVIESMLELIPKKGTMKTTIPVTIEGNEFEVEVRMKISRPTMVSSKVRLLAVGISLEFKKRTEELLFCFLKVQNSQLLLGAIWRG